MKRRIEKTRLLVIIALALIISGCPPSQQTELVNNSFQRIEILFENDKKLSLSPDDSIEISNKKKSDVRSKDIIWKKDLRGFTYRVFRIKCDDKIYDYGLSIVEFYSEIVERRSGIDWYRFEVTGDCGLYAQPSGKKLYADKVDKGISD
ncbi:hypothetical protein [Gynuella sunshinyii]|uniref:hypothetical protein n=1 Tax=Gynuella sunshinyii TaxID=1445505 RepID=UPI0005CBBF5B|nr:hypothetical protein [Gynuella sunshinyii]